MSSMHLGRGDDVRGVFLSDLGDDLEAAVQAPPDDLGARLAVDVDRAVRDLDHGEAEGAGPAEVGVDDALPDRDLEERAAGHDIDARGPGPCRSWLREAAIIERRRPERQLDHVDVVGGQVEQIARAGGDRGSCR